MTFHTLYLFLFTSSRFRGPNDPAVLKKVTEGNTGLHYIKSNAKTIALLKHFFNEVHSFSNQGKDDQWMFWKIANAYKNKQITHYNDITHNCESDVVHNDSGGGDGRKSNQVSLAMRKPRKGRSVTSSSGTVSYNAVTTSLPSSSLVHMCAIDNCLLTSGQSSPKVFPLLLDHLQKVNKHVYTVHANYLLGNMKQEILTNSGLWLAVQDAKTGYWNGQCKAFPSLSYY